ncbi:CPBP family intramembrane glutamic endopeptidase [Nesterenkonia marinintestina]|uniref:CPBP family intramembrane glutamic endopeptidase n=1 Tax=Nesterenkonia marinintestina TaxID=2979865 RepID=UPI0021C19F68|nr:type II CAAX endopeptidase family protein [Nesterenkonia sp. GX14115]
MLETSEFSRAKVRDEIVYDDYAEEPQLPRRAARLLLLIVAVEAAVVAAAALGLSVAVADGLLAAPEILAWAVVLGSVLVLGTIVGFLRARGAAWTLLGFEGASRSLWHLLWQIPAIWVCMGIVQALVFMATADPRGPWAIAWFTEVLSPVTLAALMVTFVLIIPLWEEMIHRGIIFRGLRGRHPLLRAALVSGLIFAVVHASLLMLIFYAVLGMVLAVVRDVHHNTWASVLAYSGLNAIIVADLLLRAV